MRKLIQNFFGQPPIIRLLEKVTASKIYTKLPLGSDQMTDIWYRFKDYQMNMILDVGANVGQSAQYYRKWHPHATIYSFEPIKSTYEKLKKNTNGIDIHCHQVALGDKEEEVSIKIDVQHATSVANSLSEFQQSSLHEYREEKINVTTLDFFTDRENIKHINYLKVDAEGYDLKVLKGAELLLKN